MSVSFPGCEALVKQLATARARQLDDDGGIELFVAATERAAVDKRVPVEGQFPDRDGVMIHVLIHVSSGKLEELEIFREDGAPVLEAPPPEALEVLLFDRDQD